MPSNLMVERLERDRCRAPSILAEQSTPPLVAIARCSHLNRSSTSRRNLLLQGTHVDFILFVLERLIALLLVSILGIFLAPILVILTARQGALRPTRAKHFHHGGSDSCQPLHNPSQHSTRRVALGSIERRLGRVDELDNRRIGSRGRQLAALRLALYRFFGDHPFL